MKKVLLTSIAILLIVTGCGTKKKVENKKNEIITGPIENTAPGVITGRVVDGIDIANISLTYENGQSLVLATVINNTESDYELIGYDIVARNQDGVEITTFPAYIGEVIEAGATKIINSAVDIDLRSAASLDFVVKK